MKYIVTSYINPDLDGTSCMYAYAEFLRKQGKNSNYYIEGNPVQEVEIVCKLFNISLKASENIDEEDKVVVVDTHLLENIPAVKTKNIVEFIDHHIITEKEKEKISQNAVVQIEMVGAAATLVAERFQKNKIEISRESAILLYYGIISNTINLKAKVTTRRDLEMIKWLKGQCSEISDEKVSEIFREKSQIRGTLKEAMEAKMVWEFNDQKIIIAQVEYANIEEFLAENETEIRKILKEIKQEKNLDYIFINCVDILKGYSTILVVDDETQKLITNLLNAEFINDKAKLKDLILRKEIFRKLNAKA